MLNVSLCFVPLDIIWIQNCSQCYTRDTNWPIETFLPLQSSEPTTILNYNAQAVRGSNAELINGLVGMVSQATVSWRMGYPSIRMRR
jgi:hypothetical protein